MSGTLGAHRRELRRKIWVGTGIVLFAGPAALIVVGEGLYSLLVLFGAAV
jgi:hypothetical protein